MIYHKKSTPPASIIEYNYLSPLTMAQEVAFTMAQNRWNSIITEELEPVTINGVVTTKIIVDVTVEPIDGSGNILGQAGPTSIRAGSGLPATGEMFFDSADLADLEAIGLLDEVVFHELGHVIGIGTLWNFKGLLSGAGTTNPEFTGPAAMAEYAALAGFASPMNVPVENAFGGGSNDSHWRESLFDEELMTSQLDPGVNPISALTIASVEDLGYQVDYSQAEPYSLPGSPLVAIGVEGDFCCSGAIIDVSALPIIE